ncbi:MAG: HK97 family phage prohead protease [Pirellulales bacterium]
MGKYDHINFSPPKSVRKEAQKGLDWRSEHGRGGTSVGIARARDLSNGVHISPSTAKRMKAYFDRHESDKKGKGWTPGEKGFPSNGRIAWALWGSDAGWSWAKKLVRQINAADEKGRSDMNNDQIETRSFGFDDVEDSEPQIQIERRTETRDGKEVEEEYLVGYAARFGVNSLTLDDFQERIDPNAFRLVTERRGRKAPLETRALFNHDPNHVLGRFPGTLSLSVDERGLKYKIKMPKSRRDIIEAVERGDIRGSSFSFMIAKGGEEWSVEQGMNIRTVTKVDSLLDVGPVTFPAYPDATVSVARRSLELFKEQQDQVEETRAEETQEQESRCEEYRDRVSELQGFLNERENRRQV